MLPPACLPQTFFHVVKQANVPARCLIAWNRPEHSYVHSPTSLLAQIIAPLVSAKKPGECAYQHAMKCRFYWIECRSGLSVGYFRSLQIAHWRPHSNVCPSTMLGIWAPLTVKRKKVRDRVGTSLHKATGHFSRFRASSPDIQDRVRLLFPVRSCKSLDPL